MGQGSRAARFADPRPVGTAHARADHPGPARAARPHHIPSPADRARKAALIAADMHRGKATRACPTLRLP